MLPPIITRRHWLQGSTLALLAGGCSHRSNSETGAISVGAFMSLSGEETQFGVDSQRGVQLATEECNAAGGIHGRPVKMSYEDDKSNPQETTRKIRQLIDRHQVVAILGEASSSLSLAGGLIANAHKVPMISPSSTNIIVTYRREYVFRVCFTDVQQAAAAAELMLRKLKKTRLGILYAAQDPYSSGLTTAFRAAVKQRGGEIVSEKGFQKGEKNFRTYLQQLMAPNPEMIFAPLYYGDMVPIAQQAHEAGVPGSIFVGGDGWDAADLLEGAGAQLEGAFFMNHYAPDVPWNESKRFIDAFQQRFGKAPSGLNAQAYDAAQLLFDAMKRASRLDPKSIRDAIAETRNFHGATGNISINAQRNADKPVVIVKIQNNEFHYFDTIDAVLRARGFNPPAPSSPFLSTRTPPVNAWIDAILHGLAQGSMVALVALGYTMVYGILKLINFAHSEVFMAGGFTGYACLTRVFTNSPLVVALGGSLLGAMAVAVVVGLLVERVAYRPLLKRGGATKGVGGRITPLVTAISMSVLLQNVATLLFNARPKSYPHMLSHTQPVIVGTSLVVMVALHTWVQKTWTGKAMRALATNVEAARLMGIRTQRIIVTTFAVGSALAALGAVLYCFDQSQVYPTMGQQIGTRAFVAAVVGGIGSLPGAMLGGLLLGVVGELTKLTSYSGGQDVLTFVVLIVVLLIRPTGLLGRRGVEKV